MSYPLPVLPHPPVRVPAATKPRRSGWSGSLSCPTPPQQEGDQGDQGEQGDEGDQGNQPEQGDEGGEGQEQPPQQQASPQVDPSQLLQGVRDREAQRRRAGEQGQTGYDTVEKDW